MAIIISHCLFPKLHRYLKIKSINQQKQLSRHHIEWRTRHIRLVFHQAVCGIWSLWDKLCFLYFYSLQIILYVYDHHYNCFVFLEPRESFCFSVFSDKVTVLPKVLDYWLFFPPTMRFTNFSPLRQYSFCQPSSLAALTCRVSWNPQGPGCLRCLCRNQQEDYGTLLIKWKPLNISVNRRSTQCLLSVPSSSSQTAS